ncbi:MAG: hypothetical protein WCW14_00065 [Candidatus Paceibacterota bacterium]|jgi:hypothetical protein
MVLAYLFITLVITVIRSVVDYNKLSWIGGDRYSIYLWARLQYWLAGIVAFVIIASVTLFHNDILNWLKVVEDIIGIFVILIVVLGGFTMFSSVLGAFMPIKAILSDYSEIA